MCRLALGGLAAAAAAASGGHINTEAAIATDTRATEAMTSGGQAEIDCVTSVPVWRGTQQLQSLANQIAAGVDAAQSILAAGEVESTGPGGGGVGQWQLFNDSTVRVLRDWQDVVDTSFSALQPPPAAASPPVMEPTESPYMLFYHREGGDAEAAGENIVVGAEAGPIPLRVRYAVAEANMALIHPAPKAAPPKPHVPPPKAAPPPSGGGGGGYTAPPTIRDIPEPFANNFTNSGPGWGY